MSQTTSTIVSTRRNGVKNITTIANGVIPNIAPYSYDIRINTAYNTAYQFQLTDFTNAFYSGDGDTLYSIKVLSIPNKGTLKLDGVPVNINDIIYSDQIVDLQYTPATAGHGINYTSFEYIANDNGIPPNPFSETIGIVTINVLNNNPPVVDNKVISVAVNTPHTFAEADFSNNYYDVEGNILYKVKIQTLPDFGTLLFSGSPIEENDEFLVADIANIVYHPPVTGEDSTFFNFTVRDSISGYGMSKKIIIYVGLSAPPLNN